VPPNGSDLLSHLAPCITKKFNLTLSIHSNGQSAQVSGQNQPLPRASVTSTVLFTFTVKKVELRRFLHCRSTKEYNARSHRLCTPYADILPHRLRLCLLRLCRRSGMNPPRFVRHLLFLKKNRSLTCQVRPPKGPDLRRQNSMSGSIKKLLLKPSFGSFLQLPLSLIYRTLDEQVTSDFNLRPANSLNDLRDNPTRPS
jgi:hypothetical protein